MWSLHLAHSGHVLVASHSETLQWPDTWIDNLLTASWKNTLAEIERMESRVESKREKERECPIRPTQVLTYHFLCVPVTQRFIKQTLPFPKIHIETIFGQTWETEWLSSAVMGIWSSEWGSEVVRRVASALVVSLQKPWKGGDVGCRTRVKDCQKTDKKEAEMIKKLPQPPCLPVPTRWNLTEWRLEPPRV